MSSSAKFDERALRKRLLRLEAETHRLEIASTLQELRRPMTHLRHAPALLGLLGSNNRVMDSVTDFLAAKRLGWIVKAVPLALAGWRIANLIRGIFLRHGSSERPASD
jgi:hypothetical protein